MKLTPELKAQIDAMDYYQLLKRWRFAPLGGDEMMQDESGDYWGQRMNELKDADPVGAVQASKMLGWGRGRD